MSEGNCVGHSSPDDWYPDVPRGAPTPKKLIPLGKKIGETIALCNSCPMEEECLEEGMKPENLAFGIWGGTLAGERIIMTGKRFNKLSDEGRALISYRVLKPWIEVPV